MSLLKYVADKVKGFEVRRINAVSGIYIVDKNGYIGLNINDYSSQNGSPYPGNYAYVALGPDYSSLGKGRVTFLEYNSTVIGDKEYITAVMPDGREWMCQNLDFKADGISINPNGNPSTASAWYYGRDEATYGWEGKKYGLLYNWYAAKALTIAGWHLPSTSEWDSLATACGGIDYAGTKLKSTTDWTSGNGTDNYGFNAKPSGTYTNGTFGSLGSFGLFWTSTESSNNANFRGFYSGAAVSYGNAIKNYGYSVRLVKDY